MEKLDTRERSEKHRAPTTSEMKPKTAGRKGQRSTQSPPTAKRPKLQDVWLPLFLNLRALGCALQTVRVRFAATKYWVNLRDSHPWGPLRLHQCLFDGRRNCWLENRHEQVVRLRPGGGVRCRSRLHNDAERRHGRNARGGPNDKDTIGF